MERVLNVAVAVVVLAVVSWSVYRVRQRAGFPGAAWEAVFCFFFPITVVIILVHMAVAKWPALGPGAAEQPPTITADQAARWSRTRRLGKGGVIGLVGMLAFGVPMGLLWGGLLYAVLLPYDVPFVLALGFTAVPALVAGYLLGAWLWQRGEQQYAASQSLATTRDGELAELGAAADRGRSTGSS
jgi:hypothetical protein